MSCPNIWRSPHKHTCQCHIQTFDVATQTHLSTSCPNIWRSPHKHTCQCQCPTCMGSFKLTSFAHATLVFTGILISIFISIGIAITIVFLSTSNCLPLHTQRQFSSKYLHSSSFWLTMSVFLGTLISSSLPRISSSLPLIIVLLSLYNVTFHWKSMGLRKTFCPRMTAPQLYGNEITVQHRRRSYNNANENFTIMVKLANRQDFAFKKEQE